MNFEQMKAIEPELSRLEESAECAGEHDAEWWAVSAAVYEAMSKCVGRGAVHEELQSAEAFEVARMAMFKAWRRGAELAEETCEARA